MTVLVDILVTAAPFAAGAWAAWALPRWAGETTRRPAPSGDWSPADDWAPSDLPSRPYRDLSRIG